jgi:glycosyltransferase involved in cell wall biosynthesis
MLGNSCRARFEPEQYMDELRVMCLVKRWENHTTSGGYDQLARAVGGEVVRRRTGSGIVRRIRARLWRQFFPKGYLFDYRFDDWLVEVCVLVRSWWRPPDVVHVLYGDEQLDLLLRRRRLLSCPLIATFHLPPHRVRERFEETQRHLVPGIDVAVVVARNQLQAFGNWLGANRVIYVPHGIDTDRFCPGDHLPRRDCVRLITVGDQMRDWKVLDEIIDQCQARRLEVRFDIVALKHRISGAAHLPNVHFHSRIPEEHLIRLYREAHALLLPISDGTANNAVLEALSCGTPVISNAVGGIPDYVDKTCGWLFERSEVDRIVRLIGDICNEQEIALSRRSAARSKALDFSWKRVAAKMRIVYEAVANGRSPASAAERSSPGMSV